MKIFLIGLLSLFACLPAGRFIGLLPSPVWAESMSSDNYKLELKQTENQPQKLVSPPPTEEKTFTITQTNDFFEFSISDNFINFGALTPTNPIIRTTTLSTNHSKTTGYSVVSFENHELSADNTKVIPDTTCDDGFCKEDIASNWTNILTYGFGYRCENITSTDCLGDFLNPDTYKHFSNNSKKQPPQVILKSTPNSTRSKADIIYKVNVSNNFKPGQYENTVTYVAIPNF